MIHWKTWDLRHAFLFAIQRTLHGCGAKVCYSGEYAHCFAETSASLWGAKHRAWKWMVGKCSARTRTGSTQRSAGNGEQHWSTQPHHIRETNSWILCPLLWSGLYKFPVWKTACMLDYCAKKSIRYFAKVLIAEIHRMIFPILYLHVVLFLWFWKYHWGFTALYQWKPTISPTFECICNTCCCFSLVFSSQHSYTAKRLNKLSCNVKFHGRVKSYLFWFHSSCIEAQCGILVSLKEPAHSNCAERVRSPPGKCFGAEGSGFVQDQN